MTAAGFSTSGIAAGSAAAVLQVSIGNVAAGSAFAVAQCLGATGVIATLGVVGGACLLAVGTVYGGYKAYKFY